MTAPRRNCQPSDSDPAAATYLGWDVGGTKSAVVVGTAEGRILDRREWPSEAAAGPDAMIGEFVARAWEMLDTRGDVESIGVSIGGPLNTRTGVILSPPHLPGWDRVPLREMLQREFGLPARVEHDAAACLLAEHYWGAAAGARWSVYLTCGTGCGAGVMIDGHILRGPAGQTPEAGHVRMADDGPEAFGKCGSAESFSSGEGLAKLGAFLFPRDFPEPIPPARLVEMARAGHNPARAVLAESARRTGQLCAALGDLFAPEVIVLGSLARYLGPDWLDGVSASFAAEALPVNAAQTRIVPAGLGERLQDLSAVAPCLADGPAGV